MQEREEVLELRDYLEILLRRLPVALIIFGITIALVVGFTLTREKIYEAIAKVRVITQKSYPQGATNLLGPAAPFLFPPYVSLETYLQALSSRPYLESASQYIREQSKEQFIISAKDMQSALEKGKIKLEVPKDSEIILIRVKDTSPERAMWIANGLANAFVQKNQEETRQQARITRKFIEEQLYGNPKTNTKGLYQRLLEAEEKAKEFKEKEGVFSLDEDVKQKIQRLASLQAQLEEAQASANSYKASVEFLENQLKKEGETVSAGWMLGENPVVGSLRQQLVNLQVQLLGLQQKYEDTHPEVIAVKKQIEEIEKRIQTEAQKATLQENLQVNPLKKELTLTQVELLKAEAQRTALSRFVSQLEAELSQLPAKTLQLANLEREVMVTENLYTTLQQRLQEARIAEATTLGNISLQDLATLPEVPIYPKKTLNYALGFILALVLSGVGVVLLEYLDDTIKSPRDLERRCGIVPFGIIPRFEDTQSSLVILEQRSSHSAEAFRTLRSSIRFSGLDRPLKVLLITSPEPSEGKSTVSANLAVAFAQAGQKTILLDADLRRPRVHEIFNLSRDIGLTNLLVGEASLEQVLNRTEVENLYVITCGPIPPNPVELLESQRMRDVLEELKKEADIIVIDSPLVLGMADAVVLSSLADGALIVVETNRTSRNALNYARRLLENANARILGAVMNKVDIRGAGYGYYYYYYYYYEEGGEERRRRRRR